MTKKKHLTSKEHSDLVDAIRFARDNKEEYVTLKTEDINLMLNFWLSCARHCQSLRKQLKQIRSTNH